MSNYNREGEPLSFIYFAIGLLFLVLFTVGKAAMFPKVLLYLFIVGAFFIYQILHPIQVVLLSRNLSFADEIDIEDFDFYFTAVNSLFSISLCFFEALAFLNIVLALLHISAAIFTLFHLIQKKTPKKALFTVACTYLLLFILVGILVYSLPFPLKLRVSSI